jgi:hypothetical protein
MTPGSSAPVRVPISRPSTGVKLIVVAILRCRATAHMLAPLPRWAMTIVPSADFGRFAAGPTGAGVGFNAEAFYACPNFAGAQHDVFINAGPG